MLSKTVTFVWMIVPIQIKRIVSAKQVAIKSSTPYEVPVWLPLTHFPSNTDAQKLLRSFLKAIGFGPVCYYLLLVLCYYGFAVSNSNTGFLFVQPFGFCLQVRDTVDGHVQVCFIFVFFAVFLNGLN